MTLLSKMSAPILSAVRNIAHPFASQMSFLDPQLTKDGKPWGPERYKAIVKERYLISKNLNTSYNDIGNITPIEREYLLSFIDEDLKRTKDMLNKQMEESKVKRH